VKGVSTTVVPGAIPETRHGESVGLLLSTFGRFRRQLGRLGARSFDSSEIGATHAEFLRLVGRHPGISVKAAAAEMGLAANSVSTVVSALVRAELLVRTPDPADRRVMRLHLTADAQRVADTARRHRHELLSAAFDRLDSAERADLARGLAVLAKLTDVLRERELSGDRS
jgi:DNA-binding MarR family transcriptional regulator